MRLHFRHRPRAASAKRRLLPLAIALAFHVLPARADRLVEPVANFRVGLDTNPVAVGGPAEVLGTRDAVTMTASLAFAFTAPARTPGKMAYAIETVRFNGWSDENFTSHRLGFARRSAVGDWRWSADGSTVWIDGSRDTLAALSACNGNATTVWRERRAQFQHRAKLLAQRDTPAARIRIFSTALCYDYRTHVVPGRAAFADRSDVHAGVDAGWKHAANSVGFLGLRSGRQHQDSIPLPGGRFDYSSRYTRVVVGWERQIGPSTTLAFSAGPDFRRFDGAIDPNVFPRRSRTFAWFDASLTTQLSPKLSLTGKSSRWTWLSSTGKSAYNDLAAELTLAWELTPSFSVRAAAKAHQCSYFPVVRNDWETLSSLGATYRLSPTLQITADALHHHGWNELPAQADRRFSRAVLSLGLTVNL